jgi:hypothetical protein
MRTVFLVQPDEAESARKMEQILLSLPEDAGILFASVSVIPDPLSKEPRKALYRVVIGCSRTRDVDLISMIAGTYLRQEIKHESQLTIEVHRGIDRRGLNS